MPNSVWPSALCPAGLEWRLVKAGAQLKSPFTGSVQSLDFIGDHWEVNISLHGEGREQVSSGLLESLLMNLAGGVNAIDIYNWRRPVPLGTLRGTPTLQAAAALGDYQLVLAVSAGSTLEPGDLVGTNGHVFMCRTACAAIGTTLTVPLVNRVHGVMAAGSAVVWDKPLLAVVMPEMGAGLSYYPGQTLPVQIRLIEGRVFLSPPTTTPPAGDWTPEVYRVNQLYHYDASNNVSLVITDSSLVNSWADSSPKLRHATQTVELSKPYYVVSSDVNGLPAVRNLTDSSASRFLASMKPGRDVARISTTVTDGVLTGVTPLYYDLATVRPELPPTPVYAPHVFCFVIEASGAWTWRVDGEALSSGVAGPFFEGGEPVPGVFFMVVHIRSGGGGNGARIMDMGTILNAAGPSSTRNADADLSEMLFLANVVAA